MAKYEDGDIVTAHFVVLKKPNGRAGIQAWSMDKATAQCYMKFHSCPHFKLKSLRATIREINQITEENIHDTISIYNIRTHNPDKPESKKPAIVQVPMTATEYEHIISECGTFMSNDIDYSLLLSAYEYMTPEYQKLFQRTLMPMVAQNVIHGKHYAILDNIEFDHLLVLARSFPGNFGE